MATHRVLGLVAIVMTLFSYAYAEDNPTYTLSPVTVTGKPDSQKTIGPYNQPTWAAKGRFSANTDVYVLPPYTFVVDLDYEATVPKSGKTGHLFTQEFELGLPYRFQIAYENNFEVTGAGTQVTYQTLEARYALADWGRIPLNPTLFVEYKLGVGKDYESQEDPDDPVSRLPDSLEIRLLLGEQFGKNYQWTLNIFHEQQMGGELEYETGFSQALIREILDDRLKAGFEMLFVQSSDAGTRTHPRYEFDIGPDVSWKPSQRTQLDLAMLFGTTEDSPSAKIYIVFSYSFGEGREDEVSSPVSTKNR